MLGYPYSCIPPVHRPSSNRRRLASSNRSQDLGQLLGGRLSSSAQLAHLTCLALVAVADVASVSSYLRLTLHRSSQPVPSAERRTYTIPIAQNKTNKMTAAAAETTPAATVASLRAQQKQWISAKDIKFNRLVEFQSRRRTNSSSSRNNL